MIIIAPRILKIITGNFASAMALWPFILVQNKEAKESRVTINHEKIHLRQQFELFIFPFFILYLGFYIYYRLCGMNHFNAYMTIPFEKEAYFKESEMEYLQKRSFWNWIKFMRN